jgi:hypothetical protein
MLHRLFPGALDRSEDAYDTAPFGLPARGHLRRHPATRRTRWLWLVPLAGGLAAVLGWVVAHDPGPGLALSGLGWFTVALAALLAVLLSIHRGAGRLLRAAAEYVVVALLAVLLVTTSAQHTPPPATHPASRADAAARAADACPSIVQLRAWLTCLWNAGQQAARNHPPTTTPKKGHAMAPSPTPPLTVKWG